MSELPIENGRFVDLVKKRGFDILLACTYADTFMIQGQNLLTFMVVQETTLGVWNTRAIWSAADHFITGAFWLDGQIVFKGQDVLVGAFSYQLHKHGFIWGHDLVNRCTPL